MVSILLLVLECLKELFLVVVVGGFVAIASAGLIIYILTKLLGADRMKELMDLESERRNILNSKMYIQMKEDDYIYTEDGEAILYDEDTQE